MSLGTRQFRSKAALLVWLWILMSFWVMHSLAYLQPLHSQAIITTTFSHYRTAGRGVFGMIQSHSACHVTTMGGLKFAFSFFIHSFPSILLSIIIAFSLIFPCTFNAIVFFFPPVHSFLLMLIKECIRDDGMFLVSTFILGML